jgi:hypothetical protein
MEHPIDEHIFSILEEAAASGMRCPTNPTIADHLAKKGFPVAATTIPSILRRLIRDGRIIIRVYGGNWRDVTLCTGAEAGKSTLPPPHGGNPYTILDAAERARRDRR